MRADANEVLAQFDGKKETLNAFCSKTRILLEELLQDANIRYQSVQARVKNRDKLRQKYLRQPNYERLDDITDQVALRIIVYYEDEVDPVADVIKREFDVDPRNSVDKRETEPDKFGYYALNYVCRYSEQRAGQAEYKRFGGIWCEVQIISILRHAWSEIEHPWYDLKEAFPDNIRRRFARMAALLEIAESEFLSLKKLQSDYTQAVAVQVEANVPDLPVDAVSVRSFIEQEPLVAEIDGLIGQAVRKNVELQLSDLFVGLVVKALRLAGMNKLQDVRSSLATYKKAIPEFARQCARKIWIDRGETTIAKGVSLFHLCVLIVYASGPEKVSEFEEIIPLAVRPPASIQIALAKDAVAKYVT